MSAFTNGVGPLDFYRYLSAGVRSFSTSSNITSYFSLDGGITPLVYFNQFGNSTDFGDWGDGVMPADGKGNSPPQVQDASGVTGTQPNMGANELIALDVVGYTLQDAAIFQSMTVFNGSVTMNFITIPGRNYQVQSSSTLSPPAWENDGPSFTASGGDSSFTEPISTGKFYRVVSSPGTNGAAPQLKRGKHPAPLSAEEAGESITATHRYLPKKATDGQR